MLLAQISSPPVHGFLLTPGTQSPPTIIDVPGATATVACGINGQGQVVGAFTDSSGQMHGFLYNAGAFTTIDVPGAAGTAACGINGSGQIVGAFADAGGHYHGFLDNAGVITAIDAPGAVNTAARAINDSGQIVGVYDTGFNDQTGRSGYHGFLDTAGAITTIDAPQSYYTIALGVNNSGQVVGVFRSSNYNCVPNSQPHVCTPPFDGTWYGFVYSGGAFTTLNDPAGNDPSHGADGDTIAAGVNGIGQIAGIYRGRYRPFVYHSFLSSGAAYTTIDLPGATFTFALGINTQGQVVGAFLGAGGPIATLVDPVPALLNGPAIWKPTDTLPNTNETAADLLATQGTVVKGVAADGVTEVLIRIPAQNEGDQFTLTLDNDQGVESNSADDDGGLGNPGDTSFTQRNLSVTAVSTTSNGPMAFAVYRAPVDFVRPTSGTGSCNGKTGTDDQLACRTVSLQIEGPSGTTTTPITIVRPPVILIHGIWDNSQTWDCFSPLFTVAVIGNPSQCVPTFTDARFFVGRADYSYEVGNLVTSVSPPFDAGMLAIAQHLFSQVISANSLGFAYNAQVVAAQIEGQIQWFKSGQDPAGIPVAAVQADIVAHSMGGDIARTIAADSGYLSDNTFGQGDVHKLITIDTPHLGTPLPIDVLLPVNDCVRNVLAVAGDFAFQSAIVNGRSVTGAAGDLEGDGSGGSLSPALQHLTSTSQHLLPTALISGVMNSSNLAGLNGALLHQICGVGIPGLWPALNNPLALALTPTGWPTVFRQPSDGIVPLSSQLNNTGPIPTQQFFGFVHSAGTEKLGFTGPSVLPGPSDWTSGQFTQSQLQKVAAEVINLLNTPVTNQTVFTPVQP